MPATEYPVILRLAEQYLIGAKTRGHLNKLDKPPKFKAGSRPKAGLVTPVLLL